MNKFPSIEQFRHVIKNVNSRTCYAGKDENDKPVFVARTLPTLRYRGTVKLHGTNAGIVQNFDTDGGYEVHYQSRERELTLTEDNAGFYAYMKQHEDAVHELLHRIGEISGNPSAEKAVFGEWAGGNIQKGIAISGLDKFFAVFAIRIGDEWQDMKNFRAIEIPDARIFNILSFGCYEVDIDFERPQEAQNILVQHTIDVETECPAGRYFGKAGVGEGIVWQCVAPGYNSSEFWFKVKGEKHSASKVKTLAAVDVEAVRKVSDFVDATVTEARLEQGLQNLVNEQQKPFAATSMGDFIRWVHGDIMKEEADTIIASGLDVKKLGGPIANKARKWFMTKLDEDAGLAAAQQAEESA
jgi:hypothetical protein